MKIILGISAVNVVWYDEAADASQNYTVTGKTYDTVELW
jgi:hypothetical protein